MSKAVVPASDKPKPNRNIRRTYETVSKLMERAQVADEKDFTIQADRIQETGFTATDSDFAAFRAEVIKPFVKTLNGIFKSAGIAIDVSDENYDFTRNAAKVEAIMHHAGFVVWANARCNGLRQHGIVHQNQLRTFEKVLRQLKKDPTRCILILGMMQIGKNGTSNLIALVGPIFYVMTDGNEKYYPITVGTARTGHTEYANIQFKAFMDIYGQVIFRSKKIKTRSMTMEDYRHSNQTLYQYQTTIMSQAHGVRAKERELAGDQSDRRMISRTSSKTKNELIKAVIQEARDTGYTIVFVIDEIHWGCGEDSMAHLIFKSMHDELANNDSNHIFIGLSATPYHLHGLENIFKINHVPGDGYRGINIFMGEVIEPELLREHLGAMFDDIDFSVKTHDMPDKHREAIEQALLKNAPTVLSFADISKDIDVQFLNVMDIRRYRNRNTFNRWATDPKTRDDAAQYLSLRHLDVAWASYRERFLNTLAAMINHVVETIGRGVLVRFENNNENTGIIIEKIMPLLNPQIKVRAYTGDAGKKDISKFITENFGEDSYALFVTGAARMADSFPGSCLIGIEFASKPSTHSANLQGIFGRLCGYGKDGSTIIVPNETANLLRKAVKTGQILGKAANGVVRNVGDKAAQGRRGRGIKNFRLEATSPDPIVQQTLHDLETQIVARYLDNSEDKMSEAQKLTESRSYVPLFHAQGLSEARLHHFETTASMYAEPITLLRPALHDLSLDDKTMTTDGDSYDVDPEAEFTHCKIGFRFLVSPRGRRSNDSGTDMKSKSDRLKPGGTGRKSDLQPQFHVYYDPTEKRWRLHALVIRMLREVRGADVPVGEQDHQPDPSINLKTGKPKGGYPTRHQTAEERERVLAGKAAGTYK